MDQPTLAVLLALTALLPAQQDPGSSKPPAAQDQDKNQQKDKAKATLAVGDTLPADLKLKDADGKAFSFAEQKGKVVMVHFWSITCPWEKVAEPKLNQLKDDFADKDYVQVAINANGNEIGKEPAWEKAGKDTKPYADIRDEFDRLNHRLLFDHSGDVARKLGARTTPHCFVIDKEGKLVYAGGLDNDGKSPDVPADKQYVRLAIEAALAGKPVATATTKPYG